MHQDGRQARRRRLAPSHTARRSVTLESSCQRRGEAGRGKLRPRASWHRDTMLEIRTVTASYHRLLAGRGDGTSTCRSKPCVASSRMQPRLTKTVHDAGRWCNSKPAHEQSCSNDKGKKQNKKTTKKTACTTWMQRGTSFAGVEMHRENYEVDAVWLFTQNSDIINYERESASREVLIHIYVHATPSCCHPPPTSRPTVSPTGHPGCS
jgi:hypothetical protein